MANQNARLATLDELIEKVFPVFISPVPPRDTVRTWLDKGKVQRFKSNPSARRGGGTCYYSVPDTEKLLRRTFTKMAA